MGDVSTCPPICHWCSQQGHAKSEALATSGFPTSKLQGGLAGIEPIGLPGSQDGCCSFRYPILSSCLKARRATSPHTFFPWNPSHSNVYSWPTDQNYVGYLPLNKSQAKKGYLLCSIGPIMIELLEGHLPWTKGEGNCYWRGHQQYLPFPEGARRTDKGLIEELGTCQHFQLWGEKWEWRRKDQHTRRRECQKTRKESFQKEEVTNSFKHYREVK